MIRTMLTALSAMAIWLAAPASVRAGDGRTAGTGPVVVLGMQDCCRQAAWPGAERALAKELLALGLHLVVIPAAASTMPDRRIELATVARQYQAVCALRILHPPEGRPASAEICFIDPASDKEAFRRVRLPAPGDQQAALLAALKVVETLQASVEAFRLLSTRPAQDEKPDPAGTVETVIEPRAAANHFSAAIELRLGAGALGSPGGVGTLAATELCLRWEALVEFSFELDGLLSFAGRGIVSQTTTAHLELAMVRAWAYWEAWRDEFWRLAFGVGGGLLVPWADARRTDEIKTRSALGLTGYAGIGAQLGLEVTAWFRVRLQARAGMAAPEVKVRFGSFEAARFGQPLLEGLVDLEVRFN